jgi:hypothetical protein
MKLVLKSPGQFQKVSTKLLNAQISFCSTVKSYVCCRPHQKRVCR